MKKLLYILLGVLSVSLLIACQKEFLEKPETTGNTTLETVFSSTVEANKALANAYRSTLNHGLFNNGGTAIGNGTLSGISGEAMPGETWSDLYAGYSLSGLTSERSTDNFASNYVAIRRNNLIAENIDKVPDMDAATKGYVKAEMAGLNAYRYMGMFIRYGGVPIITKTLTPEDDLATPRASLQATLEAISQMAESAYAGLPDTWPDKFNGRLTKGAALAIKARVLEYAARPLFNSSTPYLSLGANNNLISFGTVSSQRWTDAVTANEAVIAWGKTNGYTILNTGGAANVPNINALSDYGTATSTPGNKETLLAYKFDASDKMFKFYWPIVNGNSDRYLIDNAGMITNFLRNYYKADGTDQDWPKVGDAARSYTDYNTRMQQMEPRFKADNFAHGINAWNNPGDNNWAYSAINKGVNTSAVGRGVAQSTKFYYLAGTREWFEFPLFRMSEFYLNLAEAYNELGNTAKALENLNIVHNRAGLPSITEVDKDKLRLLIQREWTIEFYKENRRYFDVKHWKRTDIGAGIIGGQYEEFKFTFVAGKTNPAITADILTYFNANSLSPYWNPKMFLEPIPLSEINKRILIQNPGY
ncbi:MAG: RagB/SusD family nutrient uptake outer membrane protein [Pedobacter sp.]|nr:MAG: RagB/SusD family nutrient uptake outer membrane protein [Pedobacter sp.]